jgi:hypothetical protein
MIGFPLGTAPVQHLGLDWTGVFAVLVLLFDAAYWVFIIWVGVSLVRAAGRLNELVGQTGKIGRLLEEIAATFKSQKQ